MISWLLTRHPLDEEFCQISAQMGNGKYEECAQKFQALLEKCQDTRDGGSGELTIDHLLRIQHIFDKCEECYVQALRANGHNEPLRREYRQFLVKYPHLDEMGCPPACWRILWVVQRSCPGWFTSISKPHAD